MTPDTIFRIASMTKAVTSVAAMQLVEAGLIELDQPIGRVLPELAAPQVLAGFDAAGKPRLRPARRPITLRHLLTHTAGFGYEMLNSDLIRYIHRTATPSTSTGKLASLHLPLAVRSRRALGIRHQHRLGRPGRRSGQRPDRSTSIFASISLPRSA